MVAMELKINLKLTQKLVMTPMLQQAIKLLPLARLELIQKIRQELVENPMLEETVSEEDLEEESEEGVVSSKEEIKDPNEKVEENLEIDWDNFIQDNIDKGLSSDGLTERPSIEATLKSETSLRDHLFWQLMSATVNNKEKTIGTAIIGNINSFGYVECSTKEIAQDLEVDISEVEDMIKLVQTFDPLGIGARNLQECLLIQAKALAPEYKLVEILLKDHMTQLEDKYFKILSKELKIDVSDILEAIKFIKELNPKPAQKFSDESTQYIIPDVTVIKEEGEYRIILNDDGTPLLRINPRYRRILKNNSQSTSVKEYLEEKYRSAVWLIKSIEQRRQTILKVAKSIVGFQKKFFDHGLLHLKPLILKDVAVDIDMHESTVSRVTTLKYMHTPRGIFDFKYFFHSGVGSSDGTSMSSVRVKNMIRDLIEKEDLRKPITDQQLVNSLQENNVRIARRTVTKYRKEIKILSANKRRRLY